MISKLVKEMIEQKFGETIRYSKQCDALSNDIQQVCRTTVSGSTLRRLFGFIKPTKEPRMYTLDILASYVGHKSWEELLASFNKEGELPQTTLEKLKPEQVRKGETVVIRYEPGKNISLRKVAGCFLVISSNERKILQEDEVKFNFVELHYPLTFVEVSRRGTNLGKIQVATVSGVTGIRKE